MQAIQRTLCFTALTTVILLTSATTAHKQRPPPSYPRSNNIDLAAGILDAGQLKHTVFNNGQLGTYAIEGYLVPELPCGRYRGYSYLASLDIWIGIPEGPWNPSGIQGPTVSEPTINYDTEQSDWGPRFGSLGWLHSGEVTTGDLVSDARLPDMSIMATSTIPETWPEGYVNEDGSFIPTPGQHHWPGFWAIDPASGLETEGIFTADKEVFFSISDEGYADRDDQLDQGFPTGIQIDFSVLAFDEFYAEDILFFLADVINTSPNSYTGGYIGLYFDADVEDRDSLGSIINDDEDWMKCLRQEYDEFTGDTIRYDAAYIYDYRPQPNWRAYTGITMLGTPENSSGQELGLTDWHWFDWYNRPGIVIDSRKELIQYKVLRGDTTDLLPEEEAAYFHPELGGRLDPHFDDWERIPDQYPDGLDCVFLMSTGPFNVAAGETAQVAFALLMGDNEQDLKLNAKTAHALYEHDFHSQEVTLHSPNGGQTHAAVIEIRWTAVSVSGRNIEAVDLWSSLNAGADWNLISSGEDNDGSYDWDTEDVADGTRYRILVSATDGYLPGEDCSDTTFIIDNPKPAVPEVHLLSPNGGETITAGTFAIEWWAQDADGDPLSIDIHYSPSNGQYWEPVALSEENDGHFWWDTWNSAAGDQGLIRITASDGDSSSEDRSNRYFSLYHQRSEIDAQHTAGHGNGEVHILVINPIDFSGHTYQLLFTDTSNQKLYHIFDETTQQFVVHDQQDMSGHVESPLFDGLRALIRDWPSVQVIDSLTGWTAGDCNWTFEVRSYQRHPADYELRFTAEGDTSSISQTPVPFQIDNLTEQRPVDFMLQDIDHSGGWSGGDIISFTEPLPFFTWRVTLNAPSSGDTIDPETGDIFRITVTKPFTTEDIFHFSTFHTTGTENQTTPIQPQDFRLYQNYPNPFNPSTDIRYRIPDNGYPVHTTLNIYNILGQEVRTLVNEVKEPGQYTMTWDGQDKSGLKIASGVYFYQLVAGKFSATKRMVIMK